ncbi:MAG: hypothetical protein IJ575_03920 [Selenomonadaceae bacterium]|nr:hypothetical protein [Selenomonadaceae bacterium]
MKIDPEDKEILDFLEDIIDETIIRERIKYLDLDDESQLISEEELMAELGISEEDLEKVGDVRFE